MGERHGFTITQKSPHDKPYYVVGKDIRKNILVVSQGRKTENSHSNILTNVGIKDTNWIVKVLDSKKSYTAQIRYHGELLSCCVKCSTPSAAQVIFKKPVLVASGQSIVLYDRDVCLGGGVVI